MLNISIADVIAYLQSTGKCEKCDWSCIGTDYSGLEWEGDNKPSLALIEQYADTADKWHIAMAHNARMTSERSEAYKRISDPLFLKSQRGEATHQEWLDAVAAIKTRYPMVDVPQ